MKFTIEQETEDVVVRLKLVKKDASVALVVATPSGLNADTLMEFKDGKFRRVGSVSTKGIKTINGGYITEVALF